jgi:hypothetical protein
MAARIAPCHRRYRSAPAACKQLDLVDRPFAVLAEAAQIEQRGIGAVEQLVYRDARGAGGAEDLVQGEAAFKIGIRIEAAAEAARMFRGRLEQRVDAEGGEADELAQAEIERHQVRTADLYDRTCQLPT